MAQVRPGARQTQHQWGSSGSVDDWSPGPTESGEVVSINIVPAYTGESERKPWCVDTYL